MMEVLNHPVLGELSGEKTVTITFQGQKIPAREGQSVASALLANGVYITGYSRKLSQPRGMYCGNGRCQSCLMTIDGVEHVRSCSTLVRDGMIVELSTGDPDVRRNFHED